MRTLVTFSSAAFNTAEQKSYFINPNCFGDDLARWLIAQFREAGVETDDEPRQEDFGWYFNFQIEGRTHSGVIGVRASQDDEPACWAVWLERARGLLGSIMGGRRRGVSPSAVALMHRVLSHAAEIVDIRWHDQRDFDRGREDMASSAP